MYSEAHLYTSKNFRLNNKKRELKSAKTSTPKPLKAPLSNSFSTQREKFKLKLQYVKYPFGEPGLSIVDE